MWWWKHSASVAGLGREFVMLLRGPAIAWPLAVRAAAGKGAPAEPESIQ